MKTSPSRSGILFFLSAASAAGAVSARYARESIEARDFENHENGARRLNSASAMSMPDAAELYFGGGYVTPQMGPDPKACPPPTHPPIASPGPPLNPWTTPWNGANWNGANWNGANWNGAYWKPKSSKAHSYGWHKGGDSSYKVVEPDPCSVPRGSTCDGYPYYTIQEVGIAEEGDNRRWTTALEETPEGCVLAPIPSAEEFESLVEEARAFADAADKNQEPIPPPNVWLGVTKSALDAKYDNDGNGSRANWRNVDGTPAAVCDPAIWRIYPEASRTAPDNAEEHEKYVALLFGESRGSFRYDGKLTDYRNRPTPKRSEVSVRHALYKCCKDAVVFPSCDA